MRRETTTRGKGQCNGRLRLFLRVRADKIIDPTAEAVFSRLFIEMSILADI